MVAADRGFNDLEGQQQRFSEFLQGGVVVAAGAAAGKPAGGGAVAGCRLGSGWRNELCRPSGSRRGNSQDD